MSRKTGLNRCETRSSRRRLYRHTKRLLLKLLSKRWKEPRCTLEPAVRRFLRDRPRWELSRLIGNRGVAMAAAAILLAAGAAGNAHAIPPIELSDIAAGNGGFVINGIDASDLSGRSVSSAGDVNGDGLADVIVGARYADPGSISGAGESYVIFGKADGTVVNLSDVTSGIGGFVINGIDLGDTSGRSVSGAGDVNGDGLADLIVGAFAADPGGIGEAGESYVVFGKTDGAVVNLSAVSAGIGGFVINGITLNDFSGISVSGAGDVNGDGLADLIVGVLAQISSNDAGESYVVFGKVDGKAVNLSGVTAGIGGFVINGIDADDGSGRSVSGAGDVNGDGLADVIVGARFADPGGINLAGESYVIFGKADGTAVNLVDITVGRGGFVINGMDAGDQSGRSVSGAGDVNGDGLDDLIVGAYRASPGGNTAAGESYVVFGKADGIPVNLSTVATGFGGFVINGINPNDRSGISVSDAGDVNGDGLADVIVGAWSADPGGRSNAGESYVVFGKIYGTAVNLSDIVAGKGGFVLNGIDPGDTSGVSVSGAGDVNGDGQDDIIVGAEAANPDGIDTAGESYVIFSPVPPLPLPGDTNSDGVVDITDLLAVLGAWGNCPIPCPPLCAEDTNNDCLIDITDLLTVIGHWG